MARGRPFQAGDDQRRNTAGRPKRPTFANVIAGAISPEDVGQIMSKMRTLALAGDPAAAQVIATLMQHQAAAYPPNKTGNAPSSQN